MNNYKIVNNKLLSLEYKICLFFIVIGIVLLPFSDTKLGEHVPGILRIFLSYESSLSMYFFLAFIFSFFIIQIKNKNIKEYKPIFLFYLVYLAINTISYIHGLIISPYLKNADYTLLTGSNLVLFNIVSRIFPSIPNHINFALFSTAKQMVASTTVFMNTYLMVFSFYLYFKETKLNYMHYVWLATVISVVYMLLFEIIEFAYFLDAGWATPIISKIFNSIYDTASVHGWWPPELPSNIRGLFPEPSYLSYWGTVSLFILVYGFLKEKKALSLIEYFLLCTTIFASNSRTGTMLIIGGLLVFTILYLYKNINKQALIIICIIITVSVLAFSLAIIFISKSSKIDNYSDGSISVASYLNTNINSLAHLNERSNNSRYGMIESEINVFKKYPLFGAGKELVGTHLINSFPSYTNSNYEVITWKQCQTEFGQFTLSIHGLNEYTYTLAYSGLIGFCVNTLPFVLTAFFLFINFVKTRNNDNREISADFLTMSAIIIAFGISNVWMTNYIYIIVFSCCFAALMKGKESSTQID